MRVAAFVTTVGADDLQAALQERALRFFGLKNKYADKLEWDGEIVDLPTVKDHTEVLGPDAKANSGRSPNRGSSI